MSANQASAPRVVVVGGGVIGAACAYYLCLAGCQVVVLERDELGGQTSTVAAGMLVPAAEAEHPGPLYDLGTASLRLYPELVATLQAEAGLAVDHFRSGVLVVAYDEPQIAARRAQAEWLAGRGESVEWLDRQQVRALEPELAPEVRGALYAPDGQQVSAARLTQAFLAAAGRRGARLVPHAAVDGFVWHGGRVEGVRAGARTWSGDAFVLAGGAWSGRLGAELGVSIPVEPVKGQLLALRAVPSPVRRIIFGPETYVAPKIDGTLLLGATVEQAGFDRRPTAGGVRWLLSSLGRLVPSLASATFIEARAGLRPAAPDRLPIIDRLPGQDGIWIASGHYRNGVLLAPITGRLIAALVTGRQPELDSAPFSLARFAATV